MLRRGRTNSTCRAFSSAGSKVSSQDVGASPFEATGGLSSGLIWGTPPTLIWSSTTKVGSQTMTMKNPPHPGLSVRHDCIEPLDLTITGAANILGVTRQALNNLVNGKSGISPEMAIRLAKAFGSDAETWLRMQLNYDLASVAQDQIDVSRYRNAS